MKKRLISSVLVCGLVMIASIALANKADVEKQAKKAQVTFDLKEMPANEALDIISTLSGITIKKTDIPKDPAKVTVNLNNVSVLETVTIVAQMSGLTYAITDEAIEVSGKKKD